MAQAPSFLLRLPLELRQHVYRAYYSSLNLTYPHFTPPPLTTSSRQLREESLLLYWQNVRFNFQGTKHLVDFLSSIDHRTVSNLRHISVCGYPFPLYPHTDDESGYLTYSFNYVLPLFPGLQLASFELKDPYHGDGVDEDGWGHNATYAIVEDLIQSQGFKELIYTVEHDRFLRPVSFTSHSTAPGSQLETKTTGRDPQPSTWDSMIKAKDGADSGAEVAMYRLLDDSKRRVPLKTASEAVQPETQDIADGQIEIRIKRGQGVDYVQKGEVVDRWGQRLLDMFKDLTWKEILERDLYVDAEYDPTAHL